MTTATPIVSTALTVADLQDPKKAGALFRTVLKKGSGRREVLALIALHPASALAAIQKGDVELGLTPRGSADIVDEVVGVLPDADACEMLHQHLSPERLHELLAARGDLAAAAANVVSLDDLLAAILTDVSSEYGAERNYDPEGEIDDEPVSAASDEAPSLDQMKDQELAKDSAPPVNAAKLQTMSEQRTDSVSATPSFEASAFAFVVLRSWAMKLVHRRDYDEFLERMIGTLTVQQHLLIAIWHQADCPENTEDITPDMYDAVGIDPASGRTELEKLLDSEDAPSFSRDEFEQARIDYAGLRRRQEQAGSTVDVAKDQATAAAGKIDI